MKYTFSPTELEQLLRNKWLTDSERRILNLRFRRGRCIADVAASLNVSSRTVNRMISGIFVKWHKTDV